MRDINIAVVPVAGLGTRLLPATKSQPKEMLPVGRKPVVQYVVEELAQVGVERLLFITGPGKASIENHFDLNHELTQTLRNEGKEELLSELAFERASIQYFFTRQRQLLGLGHAILCAEPFITNEPFIVALGDSIIGMHDQSRIVERMTECFHTHQADAVIAFEEVPREEVFQYGVAKPKPPANPAGDAKSDNPNAGLPASQSGKTDLNARSGAAEASGTPTSLGPGDFFEIEDLIEKPPVDEAPSNLAIAARYILKPGIFDALKRTQPGVGGEIQLTDAIRLQIREGARVYGVRLGKNETRYDIGNFGSYFRAFTEFALSDEKYGAELREYLKTLTHADHS
ncbi:UTP--glucose-1-phosphate uridylyltransferase [Balneolales bacterium ANBcel1]|nr:UTP--glucose-1-phosphate uridylyltransferase [Balneolales bacterium ANBcel1]